MTLMEHMLFNWEHFGGFGGAPGILLWIWEGSTGGVY